MSAEELFVVVSQPHDEDVVPRASGPMSERAAFAARARIWDEAHAAGTGASVQIWPYQRLPEEES